MALDRCALSMMLLALALPLGGCQRLHADTHSDSTASPSATTSPPPDPDAPNEVIALLDGLQAGSKLLGFQVIHIGAVRADGTFTVDLARDSTRVRLQVALYADEPRAPAATERYGVYWMRLPAAIAAPDEQATRLAIAVAKRIEAVEGRVPAPAGMKALARSGLPT